MVMAGHCCLIYISFYSFNVLFCTTSSSHSSTRMSSRDYCILSNRTCVWCGWLNSPQPQIVLYFIDLHCQVSFVLSYSSGITSSLFVAYLENEGSAYFPVASLMKF